MKTIFAIFGLGALGLFNSTGVATTSIPSPYKFATTTAEVRNTNLNATSTASTTKLDVLKIKKNSREENSIATTTKEKNDIYNSKKNEVSKVVAPTPKHIPTPIIPQAQEINYYTNSKGNEVQSPTYYNSVPSGASAQCRDGTYSFSQSRRGTCSHHGGVAEWF